MYDKEAIFEERYGEELMHYGTPRHSGRYPWGSGDQPYQSAQNFMNKVAELRKDGLTNTQIAKGFGMSTTEFRARISKSEYDIKAAKIEQAEKLRAKGYGYSEIARRMGLPRESSVRSLLDESKRRKFEESREAYNLIKERVDKYGFIDISETGSADLLSTQLQNSISNQKLQDVAAMLKQDGYAIHKIKFEQLGTGYDTTMNVLCKPGTKWAEVKNNTDKIRPIVDLYSEDGQLRVKETPKSIDSSRVYIRYAEDGGIDKEGVIELRRGVDDISLKNAKYAQVRILTDDKYYMKGMAVYGDVPDGYDIVYNTNKKRGTDKYDVFKEVEPQDIGKENPFGASFKMFDDQLVRAQRHYIDKDGKEQLSALNVVNEEGTWATWSKSLASQMLSKQSPVLAKEQLDITYQIAKDGFEEIMSMNNPTVRRTLLEEFASKCDSDAEHLDAAALPRQATKVILPVPSLGDKEIYAPHLRDGETVALVRYPHGGIFEIPILTVNNKNKEAKGFMENAIDAVGISGKAASQLSGADFDGDTVLCIPCDKVVIQNHKPLEGLVGFDTKQYKVHDLPNGHPGQIMSKRERGLQMGVATNLITDMTVKGASLDEIERATKYSMVVVDAYKHNLDWKKAYQDYGIAELQASYQKPGGGSSTLLSRATSPAYINERKRKPLYKMTPEEKERYAQGELIWTDTGRTKATPLEKDENGKVTAWGKTLRQQEIGKMQTVDDAYDLVSRDVAGNTTRIESVYADYANRMKALAKQARKEARRQEEMKRDPQARIVYAAEVASLEAKIRQAEMNYPLERQAQLIANASFRLKYKDHPEWEKDKIKRIKMQELDNARKQVGTKKSRITELTDREWEAVNKGALSPTRLRDLMKYTDSQTLKEKALPRRTREMPPAKVARAESMLRRGYTQAEVADQLDVPVSTLMDNVNI